MMTDLVSFVLSLASAFLSTFAVYLLVQKDFFLPKSILVRPGRRILWSRVFAIGWILAVTGVGVLGVLLLPKLWSLASQWFTQPSVPPASGEGLNPTDPLGLWRKMGIVSRITVILLFIMSGWSIGVMIDRWMAYAVARKARTFAPDLIRALRQGRIEDAIKIAEENPNSQLAQAILKELKSNPSWAPKQRQQKGREFSERVMKRTEDIVHAKLMRGLGGLATIGSTAPFVGLFGTVMGILKAFTNISNSKAAGLTAALNGIAEALVMTAIGLLVAILAIVIFGYMTNRLETFDVETGDFVKRVGSPARGGA
jgi:biopolymer transport protein ExbB